MELGAGAALELPWQWVWRPSELVLVMVWLR